MTATTAAPPAQPQPTAATGAAPTVRAPRRRGPRATAARSLLRLLPVVAVVWLVLLGGATPATAHAVLTDSDPASGEVLDRAPRQVRLTFSEEVTVADDGLRVLDPQGRRVDDGAPRRARGDAPGTRPGWAVPLRDGLPRGTYTVAWRAVSADSHPVSGAFTFAVGAPSATGVALDDRQPGGGAVGTLYDLARFTAYAGLLLLVGGAGFVWWACRPWDGHVDLLPLRRLLRGGWLALAVATLAMLALRHPYTSGGALSDVVDLAGVGDVLGTRPGQALLCRLLLLAGAAWWLAAVLGRRRAARPVVGVPPRWLTVLGGALAVGFGATWALTEHAVTGVQPWLAVPMDVLHLLAAAGWLGGLAALLVALRQSPGLPRAVVRRFSRTAFGCVVVVAVTGAYQSWRQVGLSWSALTDTAFGRLLVVKLALVALLLGAATRSRRWTARLAPSTATVAAGASAASGAGTSTARDADPSDADPSSAGSGDAGSGDADPSDTAPSSAEPVGPVRAAQLARQRAAKEAARRRRERDADPSRRHLRRWVLAEAAVALAVLAVTTALTTTEPARTEELARRSAAGDGAPPAASPPSAREPVSARVPFDTGGEGGRGTALLDLEPDNGGAHTLHLRTETPSGAPLAAPEVRVSFTLEERDIGPLAVEPRPVATGHWTAREVRLPMSGTWRVTLTIRTSDIDQVTERTTLTIG